jgi:SAM-dependent methyltransferase
MTGSQYYKRHVETLGDLFGGPVEVSADRLVTSQGTYPIVDDVIVLLAPEEYPPLVAAKLKLEPRGTRINSVERLIQESFSDEWRQYGDILPEHAAEFTSYFDLVDLAELQKARVCDLGCGMGRWSYFLAAHCRELVLVDFSEAIFRARKNLRQIDRALFFLGDITRLPFRHDFADFAFCLGVLHHLRMPALDAVLSIARYAPRVLVYLYYALDNRPWYFRSLLAVVSASRRVLSRIESPQARRGIAVVIAALVYRPMIAVGHVLDWRGYGRYVPLFETYQRKSSYRIQQDVYDRVFTPIEQRVTRRDIVGKLRERFGSVTVSEAPPYWHFLCRR